MTYSKVYTSKSPLWEETNTIPFDELILSWNGIRPTTGAWTFWVSLKEGEWLKYAEWASFGQRSFKDSGAFATSHQDVVTPKELCTSFKIKVEGDDLSGLHTLHVCLSHTAKYAITQPNNLAPVLLKEVPLQSQQVLDHPRHKDLCSPTATTTALSFLLKRKIDPVQFAIKSHDQEFDIHGNWILNVAEAYHQGKIPCKVERLPDFAALHAHLMQNRPVVVSVKGWIPGAAKPYPAGHLICVIGYSDGKVHCIDSAFADNESTRVSYLLSDFLAAWGIRRGLAYTFY